MKRENIRKANDLNKRINEVESFLLVFMESANVRRGNGNDITGFIKTKTTKEISFIGSRWFGCGTHKTEIEIPYDMVEGLESVFLDKLIDLKLQLKELK